MAHTAQIHDERTSTAMSGFIISPSNERRGESAMAMPTRNVRLGEIVAHTAELREERPSTAVPCLLIPFMFQYV